MYVYFRLPFPFDFMEDDLMIYSKEQIIKIILGLCADRESEVAELKEATTNYNFNDIGKYFSALSNEANYRGKQEAWLLFGITNSGVIKGTTYRKDGKLQELKKEIAEKTNQRMTFIEIYEVTINDKRIIAFQIPPALHGIPTTWSNAAYAREHDSVCPLPLNKLDYIRNQTWNDWSKTIVNEATIDDLDINAVDYACKLFAKRQGKSTEELLCSFSKEEVLNKAGLLIKGKITYSALLLLGKSECNHYFDGFIPRITWTLYNGDGSVKAYEHFDTPLLLAVDKVYAKIRNEKYRYIAGQLTLFPDEVSQYEADVVKEIINNCIAHSDYTLRGKINVEEFEDHLVFINEGHFIPDTVETALGAGYKPPYYRNSFLCNAMVNLYMIDTNAMGIPMIFRIQKRRCFPLPSYDLSTPNRVKVTLYGRILDKNYTQLLHSYGDLDLATVFLLDKVQKKEQITKTEYANLKKKKLVEGRYPNIYVSFEVADIVGSQAEYMRNSGLENEICKELIVKALKQMHSATMQELYDTVIETTLPAVLSPAQKKKRLSYLLQQLKNEGSIIKEGERRWAKWSLSGHHSHKSKK